MSAQTDTPASARARALKWAGWAARFVVGAVFIYAGSLKVLDPAGFAEDIANYQAFPDWVLNIAATVVPVTEILAGTAVLVDLKRRAGAIVLGSLTLAFVGLIASIIIRDIDLACGCFGKAAEASEVGWPLLARDVGLLVAIVFAYLPADRHPSESDPESDPDLNPDSVVDPAPDSALD